MDKHKSISEKNEILAACLGKMPHEEIYIIPAVREYINKHANPDIMSVAKEWVKNPDPKDHALVSPHRGAFISGGVN